MFITAERYMYLAGSSNGYFDPVFARRSETIWSILIIYYMISKKGVLLACRASVFDRVRRRRPTRARFARDERGTRVGGKDSFSSRLALDARVLFFLLGFYAGYSVTVINVWCFPLIVLRQKNALLYFQSLKCCINQILFQVIYRVNSVYLYSGLRSLE